MPAAENTKNQAPARRNYAWTTLMAGVFQLDVLECESCGGPLRIVAPIQPPDTTQEILKCLGLPCRAPPLTPAARESARDCF